MNNWDRNRQDQIFKQKLQNVKSTLPKISTKKRTNSAFTTNTTNLNNKNLTNTKKILNEFGLSQYLRKIFDLDYDDNNLYKIGLLNRKEFEEFVRNLKIFPGHFVKIENFYNYLKNNNFKFKTNNNNNYNLTAANVNNKNNFINSYSRPYTTNTLIKNKNINNNNIYNNIKNNFNSNNNNNNSIKNNNKKSNS